MPVRGIVLVLLLAAFPLMAQPQPAQVEGEPPVAAVVVDGEVLFFVRGLNAFPADRRAAAIVERIEQLAADPGVALDSIQVVEQETFNEIRAGSRLIVRVFDADGSHESLDRKTLASLERQAIISAIRRHREARQPQALLRSAGIAGAAALLLILTMLLVRWAFSRIQRRFRVYTSSRLQHIKPRVLDILGADHVLDSLDLLLRTIRVAVNLVIALLGVQFILGQFPWTRQLSKGLLETLLNPVKVMVNGTLQAVPDLVFLAVLVLVTRYILRLTSFAFHAIEMGSLTFEGFEQEWAKPTLRIVRILIIAFAIVVAYPYVPGSGSEAFKGVSLFLGVVFSLSSTSALSNVIAGYSLTYRRAFKVGDRIKIGEHVGDVTDIRLQVTHLRSLKHEELIIPNSEIINSSIVNYSSLARREGLILHTTVGIGYETPWRQVESMLMMAAERTEGLLRHPPPFVLHKALGDFAITYELNVYCDAPIQQPQLYTALHRNILDVFNEFGVQIMTPSYESDPETPKVVPRSHWFEAPASPPPSPSQNRNVPPAE